VAFYSEGEAKGQASPGILQSWTTEKLLASQFWFYSM
jgi:hypothetical protein